MICNRSFTAKLIQYSSSQDWVLDSWMAVWGVVVRAKQTPHLSSMHCFIGLVFCLPARRRSIKMSDNHVTHLSIIIRQEEDKYRPHMRVFSRFGFSLPHLFRHIKPILAVFEMMAHKRLIRESIKGTSDMKGTEWTWGLFMVLST